MEKRALLVSPEFPPSYWSGEYALPFVGKRAAQPPLGLLTVAALFPDGWSIRLVDMNVGPLTDEHLRWADYVFTSTMVVQQDSFLKVVRRCHKLGKPVIPGGPHPTSYQEEIEAAVPGQVAHFFSGEAEEVFPGFLEDLLAGKARRVYTGPRDGKRVLTDITRSPVPRFDLLQMGFYASMAVQFTRGCPYDCEFCDITALYGRVPRPKTNAQVIAELDWLYKLGWRGSVMFVDDNFVGNKVAVMRLLSELTPWQRQRGYPFDFYTEASIDLAWYSGMLEACRDAGFSTVFVGIESLNDAALAQTNKPQNMRRGETARSFLLRSVRRIQRAGIEVSAGLIVGLDSDKDFGPHVSFSQEAGIPLAMVGLLGVAKGTRLWDRLEEEGRIVDGGSHTGDNTGFSLNFVPQLPREKLLAAYREVISTLYDPSLRNYFHRCWVMIKHLGPRAPGAARRYSWRTGLRALFNSLRLQVFSRQGPAYLWFLARVLWKRPGAFPLAIRRAIHGYHFQKMTDQTIAVWQFNCDLERLKRQLTTLVPRNWDELSRLVADRVRRIHPYFRPKVMAGLEEFLKILKPS